MKIKIIIHRDLCQSVATCVAVSPSVYALDDEFKAKVIGGDPVSSKHNTTYTIDVDKGDLEKFVSGAKACPYKAIEIIDEKTGKKLYP